MTVGLEGRYELSNHTIVVDDDDEVLVVGLLKRTAVRIKKTVWSQVKKSAFVPTDRAHSELIQHLVASRAIKESSFDETEFVRQQSAFARADPTVFGIIIVPTLSCNMSCHYCFEQKSNRLNREAETLVDKIEHFVVSKLNNAETEALSLRWFGGEPLIRPKLVEDASTALRRLAQSMGKRFVGDIITNGYFLDRSTSARIANAGITKAQITLEGDRDHHDSIRRHGISGSFDRILDNIATAENLIEISVRVHVTPESKDTIGKLFEQLKARGLEAIIKSLYFAPLFNFRQDDPSRQFQDGSSGFLSSQEFAEIQHKLLKDAVANGFSTPDPLDVDYGVCSAVRDNTAVVHSDGSLAKCYLDAGDLSESFGTVYEGITQKQNLQKWREAEYANDPECASCTFSPVCLGGCSKHRASNPDKRFICTPLKFNAEKVLTTYY